MPTLTKIGFFGSYKTDIIMYLSKIIQATGRNVAIVDATEEQYWIHSVPTKMKSNVLTVQDIDFYIEFNDDVKFNNLSLKDYDIALIDFGFNKKLVKPLRLCEVNIMISDLERFNVMRLKEFIQSFSMLSNFNQGSGIETKTNKEIIKVYRDIVESKVDAKYIDSFFEFNSQSNVIMEYNLFFDPLDHKCRIESQYDDNYKFVKLSKGFKEMLLDIVEACLFLDRKVALKALKKAEKGG